MSIRYLAAAQLRMYMRDRQSVFFGLFFPLSFMLALGFVSDRGLEPVDVAVVRPSAPGTPDAFIDSLMAHELVEVSEVGETEARGALEAGDLDAVLIVADRAIDTLRLDESVPVTVLVNAAEPARTQRALTVLNAVLADIEHDIRDTAPLFTLDVEDVQARNVRYVDFLVPGLLAFMVLQLSIAGSGFNVVEYKRKDILKRLFVTPLRPSEFVASLVGARLVVILVQISLLLVVAELVFDVTLDGSMLLLYLFVIAGSVLFLCMGFALGGIANTQNAVMVLGNLVIFPQVFLAGVFFPLTSLPEWLRPVAEMLPLRFVADAIRRVANEGAGATDLGIDVLGLAVWTIVSLALAVRFFRWSEAANMRRTPR